jgi:hypothetical protein
MIKNMEEGVLIENSGDEELKIPKTTFFVNAKKFEHFDEWKKGGKWVFIWMDKFNDIHKEGDKKIKYVNKIFYYFIIEKGTKIQIEPAKSKFDFGIHRVEKSLQQNNAKKYLEIFVQDFTGTEIE